MKFAESIQEITNAFNPRPLEGNEQLQQFYCENTMPVRTGDLYSSPIESILDDCREVKEEHKTFLLLGHRGCGKSTELNKMSARLIEDGYYVSTIPCGTELDMARPDYSDLLILMGEALLKIAEKINCNVSSSEVQNIRNFWKKISEEHEIVSENKRDTEAGISVGTPELFKPAVELFAKIKLSLKYSEKGRQVYREHIFNQTGEWLYMMDQLAVRITDSLDGKPPILIFEDLDKLDPEQARRMFYNYAATLTGVRFPVIYTFPIAASYYPDFGSLEGYFDTQMFPMIKQETIDGNPYTPGHNKIREIILRRARVDLFDENVIDFLIEKTGGSLRDLFSVINDCAQRSMRRRSSIIQNEDADIALRKIKSNLTRRIEQKHYSFLNRIREGGRQNIDDRIMLLEMLQAGVVLEYNGERWHDVHPLIADFLIEQGRMSHD